MYQIVSFAAFPNALQNVADEEGSILSTSLSKAIMRLEAQGIQSIPSPCHLDDGHNLVTFYAQDVLCLGIDNGLHEAACLADFQGTGNGMHGQFRYTDSVSLFSGLVFAHANTPKLRIDEDRIRDHTLPCASIAMLKQIGTHNAEVIVRDVRESWPTFHIT